MGISTFFSMAKTLYVAKKMSKTLPDENAPGSMGYLVQLNAAKYPNKVALLCENEELTWGQFNARANQLAHRLSADGVGMGDVVALMMENRLEFLISLAAIGKVGAIGGLINTNLRDKGLTHCIELINSRKCIMGEECAGAISEIKDQLHLKDGDDYIYITDKGQYPAPDWAVPFDVFGNNESDVNLPVTETVSMKQDGFYIFTSGTTGLPKAAIQTIGKGHRSAVMAQKLLVQCDESVRLYNCLPLYHTTGLTVGFGTVLQVGGTMFIRRKFSASNFIAEVRKHNTNAFVYIGELCRYLLATESQPDDANNPLTVAFGNGLRPDIWMAFKHRYGFERIGELYGASEGNGAFINILNKDMTVGMAPFPLKIVEYDVLEDAPVKDAKGRCIEVAKGAAGLLLFQITKETPFDGYTNKEASEKKIMRNVIEDGDAYFNTGDLIKQVDVGFAFGLPHYQFSDRVGDTFRWKGENVATNEVGEVINNFPGIETTNVYGVQLPGTDGRAGMAAITLKGGAAAIADIDVAGLSAHICEQLPSYARPVFIRLLQDMDSTGTFKMMKGRFRDEGFDPARVQGDPLLVLKPGGSQYELLDDDFYQKIRAGDAAY